MKYEINDKMSRKCMECKYGRDTFNVICCRCDENSSNFQPKGKSLYPTFPDKFKEMYMRIDPKQREFFEMRVREFYNSIMKMQEEE